MLLPSCLYYSCLSKKVKSYFDFWLNFFWVIGMVKKIKELCEIKKMPISKLEKLAGLGNGTIGKWEKFDRKPKYESLKSIADALGVPISELIGAEQTEKLPATYGEQNAEVRELIRLFDLASPELRAAALAVLKSAEAAQKAQDDAEEGK